MSGQNRRKTRLMALLALSLLLLPMVTCTQPDPSPRTCAHWGGRYQYYQWPDLGPNAGAVSGYCVFGDGTVCNPQQLRDGTCTPANPLGPLSPLAYPKREFPPIHSPFATPLSPLSPEEIVSKASLIFIGEIGEVQQRTEFAVYTQDGQIESYVTDAVGNPLPNIPITDFLLTVVQVIRDDGAIASGQLIVLRLIGSVSPDMKNLTKDTEFPISFTGDRHLFLLTPNPDGQTYGLRFGPWSRLTLDGGVLHVSNGEQEPFKLAGRDEPASLEEFVAFVATQPLPGQPPAGTMELPSVPYSPLATPEVVPTSEISLYVPIGLGGSITETQPMGEVGMSAPVSPLAPPSNVGVFIGGGGVMAYPRSFEELVDSAALIVLGKVGPVVQYLDLGGYGGSDGKQPMGSPTDPTSMMLFGWPVTDLLIEVEQVIRDDGSIAAGKPIILRILGFATAESKKLTEGGEFPLSYTGDQHLFLLGANPDGTYGLTFGPRSRLIVDGDILRVSDGTQQPLLFVDSTGPISLDDLIAYVETGTLPVKENTLGLLAVPDVPIEPETTLFVDAAARRSDYLAVWPPQSLAALIKHAPLIFIGKVGPVHEYLDFYSYGEDGELILNALPEGRGPTPAYPATEFLLEVETVIRDDGTISGGEPIILQVVGHITEESKRLTQADAYPVSYTGDRHLFMLTSNVDGRSWVLEYGPWSRLIVDGDSLIVSDGARTPLRLVNSNRPITLEEFIQFVGVSPDSTHTPPDVSATASPLAMPGCSGMGLDLAYPTSLEDLVDHASLVFFGEVGPVVEYLEYCGYEDGQLLEKCKATDMAGNPAPGLPLTYFVMQVDQVLRDDGRIARGEPAILAEMGHVTPELKQLSQTSTYPLSYTGDRYLYLLGSNPDGETYGAAYGPRGRLIVDGDILRISDCEQSPLRFGADSAPVTLEELIQVIAERP